MVPAKILIKRFSRALCGILKPNSDYTRHGASVKVIVCAGNARRSLGLFQFVARGWEDVRNLPVFTVIPGASARRKFIHGEFLVSGSSECAIRP
jgi:hypothetical protein